MSNTGFTIGYNYILRDQSLSLATKGLYLVVSSYIGTRGCCGIPARCAGSHGAVPTPRRPSGNVPRPLP